MRIFTENQINVLLHEIALNILADDRSWQKIGSDLGLTDHDLSRVWDHARALSVSLRRR